MATCLYCPSETNLTDEHVFPAGLGGKAVLKDGVCKRCNEGFSNEFEAEFVNGFTFIRNLLGVPNREGEIPSIPAKVVLDGEERPAEVGPEGKIFVQSYKIETPIEGGKEIHYKTFTAAQERQLMKSMKRKGESLERGSPEQRQGEAISKTDLAFIGSAGGLRTVAKIALTGFALKAGAPYAMSQTYAHLWNYIETGLPPAPFVYF